MKCSLNSERQSAENAISLRTTAMVGRPLRAQITAESFIPYYWRKSGNGKDYGASPREPIKQSNPMKGSKAKRRKK